MLFWILAAVGVLFILARFPAVRLAFFRPLSTYLAACRDFIDYIYYRKFDLCPSGDMVCFSGLFGKGKTLSAVHTVRGLYKRYNDRKVYDPARRAFVRQKVLILSNVTFKDVPYVPLNSLADIVKEMEVNEQIDKEQHTLTAIIIFIDEASVQLNSRSFKANINPEFLNMLLTCRHYHASFYYTSQRFNLTDKLLRDVTQMVVDCRKVWRFQVQALYDAWTLENTSRPDQVKPLKMGGFFVSDSDYASYDTMAVVGSLKKSWKEGDLMTDEEILNRRCYMNQNNEDKEEEKKKRFLFI